MGTREIQKDHSLWLIPCGGIHTIGMLYSIDVVFLDAADQVCKVSPKVGLFQLRFAPKGTRSVIEMAAGRAQEVNLKVGQTISYQ